jgi:hypothetical protein
MVIGSASRRVGESKGCMVGGLFGQRRVGGLDGRMVGGLYGSEGRRVGGLDGRWVGMPKAGRMAKGGSDCRRVTGLERWMVGGSARRKVGGSEG